MNDDHRPQTKVDVPAREDAEAAGITPAPKRHRRSAIAPIAIAFALTAGAGALVLTPNQGESLDAVAAPQDRVAVLSRDAQRTALPTASVSPIVANWSKAEVSVKPTPTPTPTKTADAQKKAAAQKAAADEAKAKKAAAKKAAAAKVAAKKAAAKKAAAQKQAAAKAAAKKQATAERRAAQKAAVKKAAAERRAEKRVAAKKAAAKQAAARKAAAKQAAAKKAAAKNVKAKQVKLSAPKKTSKAAPKAASKSRASTSYRGSSKAASGRALGLTAHASSVYADIMSNFSGINSAGGYRPNSRSVHQFGRAMDLMITPGKESGLGWAIARYAAANAGRFKIDHIIFEQKIWTPYKPYWRPMEDRGSITQNHFDHVHVAVKA
ncbi:histone H1-like repetitive region-containing protein [Nigerium massiliense]|uniref:histone H1-like repetitive region-containing protein n=1 Tax=Nigerium massiliense TaxID=1522317 RepID=UPI0009E60CE3|nr:histone H1-like repetitive region-containing protein [Nigerium massiliense]